MNILSDRFKINVDAILVLFMILLLGSCASTQKIAVPTVWQKDINWENYNSAEVTSTDDIILQNKTDIIIHDGETGNAVFKDIKKKKGMFAQFGEEIKKQAMGGLSSNNDIEIKYWHLTLPESQTVLLFDRSTDIGEIRAIDLQNGTELWTSRHLSWNLEKYRDLADGVVDLAADISLGGAAAAGIASEVLLQSRAVHSMIKEIPEKDAFLFKTVDGILHLIDSKSGNSIWQAKGVGSTGIASVKYLKDRDEILLAGDMGGLKDIIKSSDAEKTMKQVYRINAKNGNVLWATKYFGRESQVDHVAKVGNRVQLYFLGGSLELFNFENGDRMFGTRDEMGMGTTKIASAISGTNSTMETKQTAMPVVKNDVVYAINPTGDINAMSLDDKQLVKYNFKTGEELWKSPVLEKTIDVRHMKVIDELVITQIPGAGNMVGGSKESGIYAFDKKTGEEVWNFSEPLSKNYTANIIIRDNKLITADGDILYLVDPEDGKVMKKHSFEESGLGNISELKLLSGNRLSVIGQKGFAIVNDRDFTPIYEGSVSGRILSHHISDQRLVIKSQKLLSSKSSLYIFDLNMKKEMTNFQLTDLKEQMYGNLPSDAYFPINDMKQVLTITESGITSYDLY